MSFNFICAIFFLILLHCFSNVLSSDRPVIGILAQELDAHFVSKHHIQFSSYIGSSYVKAIQGAGGRVIPLKLSGKSYYKNILHKLNGVLIPGGMAPLGMGKPFYDAVSYIYDKAIEINKNGTYFPILGVCLGFEALLVRANNHQDFMSKCDVLHENLPLEFTPNFRKSLLYSNLSPLLETYLKYLPITANFHYWCVTRENLTRSGLDKDWLITSENHNKRGEKFISSIEHKKYPLVGIQFHPEKFFELEMPYENPHSRIAILANRYFYDFIVDQARLNLNHFESKEVEIMLTINNYRASSSKNVRKIGLQEVYGFKL